MMAPVNVLKSRISQIKDLIHVAKQKALQEQGNIKLAKEVLPWAIQEYKDCIVINNEIYIQCIIAGIPPISDLGGYPETLNINMIDELLNIKTNEYTIAYSFLVDPIANIVSIEMLETSKYRTRVDIETYHDKSNPAIQEPYVKQLEIATSNRNIEAIFSNSEKMFNTALIIILKASSKDALRLAESHVRAILESSRVYYQFPDTKHLQTYVAAQPTPDIYESSFCQLFTYHTAALFPSRNPNNRTADTGLLFGVDYNNPGRSILLDLKALSAQHALMVGPTGSGKTYSLFLLLMRAYTMLKKRIIYITPKSDAGTRHRNVARYFGVEASLIDIGPPIPGVKRYTINPLEIIYDKNIDPNYSHIIFMNHTNILERFMSVLLLSDTKSDNMLPHISRTIYDLYKSRGISEYDLTTWKNWPLLEDIYDVWKAESPYNVTAEALMNKFEKIKLQWSYLNKQSDIDIKKDFIIFDTSGLDNSSDNLQDAFNVLITSIMGQRFVTDYSKETIIAVDEARVFLQDPKISLFLLKILTMGRSHGLSLWIAAQELTDIQKAGLNAEFMTNMKILIAMGELEDHNIGLVANAFMFDKATQETLLALKQGEGIIKVGGQIIPTIFKPTPLENDILKGIIQDKKETERYLFKINDENLKPLINNEGVCFSSWLSDPTERLESIGWTSHAIIDAITGKKVSVWLKSKTDNESVDHYCNVARIAGYFIQNGINPDDVIINHHDSVDISIQSIRFAIEYELPGSHTSDQLIEKGMRARELYESVLFVCQNENFEQIMNAVGANITVKRGRDLTRRLDEIIKKVKRCQSDTFEGTFEAKEGRTCLT